MAEELGERTEQPTGRRRFEARRKGQVAKSTDLSSALDLAGAVVLLVMFGGAGFAALAAMTRRVLGGETPGDPLDAASIGPLLGWASFEAAKVVVPALVAMFLVAAAAQLVQVGWFVTAEPLRPKLERLSPLAGFKKLFNTRNLVKTAVNTAKLAVVAAVAGLVFRGNIPAILALPRLAMAPGMRAIAGIALELAVWLLVLLLALGAIDWLYQRWQHTKDLRMTRQEVKEERKSHEGDPQTKARMLRMAHDIAMQRIQQEVPRADVIVTNPTHFAVALRYDQDKMHAPRVVAKGADYMAWRIRNVAIACGVPIVERPPLARALYAGVEVGREISPEHYEAVAEVLAYVYKTEGRAA